MAKACAHDLHKLTALQIGTDDFIVRQFNPIGVVASVKAVLRRKHGNSDDRPVLRVSVIELDTISY